MTNEQKNMDLMQTLGDAWNAQDWDTFAEHWNSPRLRQLADLSRDIGKD